jgi:hypothetical protein
MLITQILKEKAQKEHKRERFDVIFAINEADEDGPREERL